MKILIIGNNSDDFTGIKREMIEAIRLCCKTLIVCGPKPEKTETYGRLKQMKTQHKEVYINSLSVNPLKDLYLIYQIYQTIQESRPDIIFLLTLKPILYGSILSYYLGVKSVFSLNSGIGRVFSLRTYKEKLIFSVIRYALRLSFKCNRKYFFQNFDDIELFKKLKIITLDKAVRLNGTGVNLAKFKYRKNIISKKLKFIMICRLLKEKGVYEYCKAAESIKSKHPKIVDFSLVGSFDETSSGVTKKELKSWVSNHVTYLGETDDVIDYLNRHNVFVLPSYYREGVPRILLEAMAVGLPIITTNSPGCRDTVNGENGILTEPKSVPSLENAMELIITNRKKINRMSYEGRKLVEKKFNINDVNKKIVKSMGIK